MIHPPSGSTTTTTTAWWWIISVVVVIDIIAILINNNTSGSCIVVSGTKTNVPNRNQYLHHDGHYQVDGKFSTRMTQSNIMINSGLTTHDISEDNHLQSTNRYLRHTPQRQSSSSSSSSSSSPTTTTSSLTTYNGNPNQHHHDEDEPFDRFVSKIHSHGTITTATSHTTKEGRSSNYRTYSYNHRHRDLQHSPTTSASGTTTPPSTRSATTTTTSESSSSFINCAADSISLLDHVIDYTFDCYTPTTTHEICSHTYNETELFIASQTCQHRRQDDDNNNTMDGSDGLAFVVTESVIINCSLIVHGTPINRTYEYWNHPHCVAPTKNCAIHDPHSFCTHWDDEVAFAWERILTNEGFSNVTCTPTSPTDDDATCNVTEFVSRPELSNDFYECLVEAEELQQLTTGLTPDDTSTCIGTGDTSRTCNYDYVADVIVQYHDACTTTRGVSVEFNNIEIICYGTNPAIPNETSTFEFIWDTDIYCFPTDGNCTDHSETFCEQFIDFLAINRRTILEGESVGWQDVVCYSRVGAANCTYSGDTSIKDDDDTSSATTTPGPVSTSNPTPEPMSTTSTPAPAPESIDFSTTMLFPDNFP